MDKELSDLLKEGVGRIDKKLLDTSTVDVLEKLYDEITLFNPAYKLVACDGRELVIRHILDCLAPVNIIKAESENLKGFADLGSGSGLPGVVLAAALTDKNFSLVERMGRRAGFLRSIVGLTGLGTRTDVVESDLSELKTSFDAITFRAFRHMEDIASDLKRITKKGSRIFAYKSSEDDIAKELEDLNRLCPGLFESKTVSYEVPFLDAERNMLIITRK